MTQSAKIVIIGPRASGKTNLVNRFLNLPYNETERQTFSNRVQPVYIDDANTQLLSIWEVISLRNSALFKDAALIIVTVDLSRPRSFAESQMMIEQAQSHGIPIRVIGCKNDITDPESTGILQAMNIRYQSCSAKDNAPQNIRELLTPNADAFIDREVEAAKTRANAAAQTSTASLAQELDRLRLQTPQATDSPRSLTPPPSTGSWMDNTPNSRSLTPPPSTGSNFRASGGGRPQQAQQHRAQRSLLYPIIGAAAPPHKAGTGAPSILERPRSPRSTTS